MNTNVNRGRIIRGKKVPVQEGSKFKLTVWLRKQKKLLDVEPEERKCELNTVEEENPGGND